MYNSDIDDEIERKIAEIEKPLPEPPPDDTPEKSCDWGDDYLRQLLAAIHRSPECATKLIPILRPTYFRREAHRLIFRVLCEQSEPISDTALTQCVTERISREDKKNEVLAETAAVLQAKVIGQKEMIARVRRFAEVQGVRSIYSGTLKEFRKGTFALDDLQKRIESLRQSITDQDDKPKSLTIDELMALPDVEWLVRDHIYEGSLVGIYGDYGSAKTFFALDMGLSVATGKRFLGEYPVKTGAVAYLCGEGARGLKKRVQQWQAVKGVTPNNFCVYPEPLDLTQRTNTDLLADDVVRRLGCDPTLVIVDTLAVCFGGKNESDTADMNTFINNCKALQNKLQCCVVVIHHLGKDPTKGARGSTAYMGALDTGVLLKAKRDNADRIKSVTVRCGKQKDAEPFRPYSVLPVKGEHSLTLAIGQDLETNFADLPKRSVEVLEVAGGKLFPCGFALADIVSATGFAKSSTHDALGRLTQDGFLHRDKDIYTLTTGTIELLPTFFQHCPNSQS